MTQLQESGFDMSLLTDFETLNCAQYACPHCGAPDRERLYALFISRNLRGRPIGPRLRFLDIAPGAVLAKLIKRTRCLDYRSADLNLTGVDDHVDIQDMRIYPDNNFDCLICSHVLEHVPDDRKAIAELFRVLSPGGWGILMAPVLLSLDRTREDASVTDPAMRLRLFAQDDHVRLYAKRDFVERLQAAGFRVEQLGLSHFGRVAFEQNGLDERSILYVVWK